MSDVNVILVLLSAFIAFVVFLISVNVSHVYKERDKALDANKDLIKLVSQAKDQLQYVSSKSSHEIWNLQKEIRKYEDAEKMLDAHKEFDHCSINFNAG
jgi:biopolymer transport protein ExbD